MSELAVTLLRLSYLILLWLFVLAAIGVLRRDIYGTRIVSRRASKRTASAPIPAEPPRPAQRQRSGPTQLVIVSGSMSGTTVPLAGAPVIIGRAPDCNLVLDDDYSSNQHARVFSDGGTWYIEDLGSTNGTFLGPDRITEPIGLRAGDELRIGRTSIQVRG